MIKLSKLLTLSRISCDTHATSKKRALEQLSGLLAEGQSDLSQKGIFDSLIARERLGSTGFGHGVAIPHGRVGGNEASLGALVRLDQPIDFDAADQQQVDLLFALLVPEHSTDEHLQILASLAEMFSDPMMLKRLREAETPQAILNEVADWCPKT